MNDQNALCQLQLAKEISACRQTQFGAVEQAILKLDCVNSNAESKTLAAVAVFLIVLGRKIEEEIGCEIDTAVSEMARMRDLPDESQWEYRIAHTLGMIEGWNRVGAVQNQLLHKAQAALQRSALFTMQDSRFQSLPLHQQGTPDELYIIAEEASAGEAKRSQELLNIATDASQNYHKVALDHYENDAVTIPSICTTAVELASARLLLALCTEAKTAIANEPNEQFARARLIAGGIVGSLICAIVQKNKPWLSVNLN
jgi:hypothetical protein